MRLLRPDRLVVLDSGLWVVDAVQPVAAVLDPTGAGVRRLVSWTQVPPPPLPHPWPGWPARRALGDGTALWVQHHAAGPVARVDATGVTTAAWTDGLVLAACAPGVAWCAPAPPAQELVQGAGGRPSRGLGPGRLLRVGADGRTTPVATDAPVRRVRAGDDALLVQVDVEGWTLHHLGADLHEVVRRTRWLSLPRDAEVPPTLTVDEHGLAAGSAPARGADDGGRDHSSWYDPEYDPDRTPDEEREGADPPALTGVPAGGLRWHLGWSTDVLATRSTDAGGRRPVVASAHRPDGALVRRWHLGVGTVTAATALGDHLAVAVDRSAWRPRGGPSSSSVLVLDPATPDPLVLAGSTADEDRGGVDITAHCWPLVPRPLEADSYLAQVLAANSSVQTYWHSGPVGDDGPGDADVGPLAEGMSDTRTALVGDWPLTRLEWTFAYAPHPGLVLRRRVPLFDEVGRPSPPVHADIHLMEDLDTRDLPPATAARDGVLDV